MKTALCSFVAFASLTAMMPLAIAADTPVVTVPPNNSIVLAGGCFWGMQDVFQHVKGVEKVVAGYSGGDADKAEYDVVSRGNTGHAESVQITYDPSQVSLDQLMKVYFVVAHNPTEMNYQGPDHGTQYRSEVFYSTPAQQQAAMGMVDQLKTAKTYSQPIVTKIEPLKAFYPAEDYHQNYAKLHPDNPYIIINDAPKVIDLRQTYPDLYVSS